MCRKKGFRRIGLALDQSSNMRSNGLWTAGYLEIQQLLPKPQQMPPLLLPDTEFTPGRIGRWLRREKPEVVLIHRMDPKILLDHSKPAVPVVLDHRMDGPYAGIDQEYDRLGAVMADLLSRQMIRNERGVPPYPTVTLLEGTWIDHPSLDPNA
jgi:LacI family transcriptional regulator